MRRIRSPLVTPCTRVALLLLFVHSIGTARSDAQDNAIVMHSPERATVSFELHEILSIGNLQGPDVFGRLMDAALDSRGRILAVDDLNKEVVLYAIDGTRLASAGRDGEGPGEFRQPWAVGIDAFDSVFVWDAELARISVFDSALRYARMMRVAPHRIITDIQFLPSGSLLLAAFGRGDDRGLFELSRSDGSEIRSLGPAIVHADLAGFESSLLGGHVKIVDSTVVYSAKSPYAITFLRPSGESIRQCLGDSRWTSDPQTVVVRSSAGTGLQWNRYIHVMELVALGGGRWMNVIRDPVSGVTMLDVFDEQCALLARHEIDSAVHVFDRRDSTVLAARTLDFPELVLYAMRWR